METTTTFADYDGGKHVENLLAASPFLPGVTFHVNNYRTKIVRYYDGQQISRETYTYAYNARGKPTQRTTHYAGGALVVATYSY